MILTAVIYLLLGLVIGYVLGNPKARSKVLAKMNEWTKPAKKETPVEPVEKKA